MISIWPTSRNLQQHARTCSGGIQGKTYRTLRKLIRTKDPVLWLVSIGIKVDLEVVAEAVKRQLSSCCLLFRHLYLLKDNAAQTSNSKTPKCHLELSVPSNTI